MGRYSKFCDFIDCFSFMNLSILCIAIATNYDTSPFFSSTRFSSSQIKLTNAKISHSLGLLAYQSGHFKFASWRSSFTHFLSPIASFVSLSKANVSENLVVSGSNAEFVECWFSGMASAERAIYIDDSNCEILIASSRFDKIVDHSYILYFMHSKNVTMVGVCIIDCSPSESTFGTYKGTTWAVNCACLNYTVEANCGLMKWSSFIGGIEGWVFQFNNRTFLETSAQRSTYCLHHSPPYQRDSTCFNNGNNCKGPYAFDLYSDVNANFYSHFNLVNITGSSFFRVIYKIANTLSNFNFYFHQKTNWIYSAAEVFGMWDCFVGGFIPDPSPYVAMSNVIETGSAELSEYVTYAPFCFELTQIFSIQDTKQTIFLPIVLPLLMSFL